MNEVTRQGSIIKASGVMLGMSVLLFWLPIIGPAVAGFMGGKRAGNVPNAVIAVFLPGLAFWALSALAGGFLSSLPVVGLLFGIAGQAVGLMSTIPLLVGAVIGGLQNS